MRDKKPRTVEMVKSSYQPTKAELEEEIELDFPEGLSDSERFEALGDAMVQPVKARWIEKPRNRR